MSLSHGYSQHDSNYDDLRYDEGIESGKVDTAKTKQDKNNSVNEADSQNTQSNSSLDQREKLTGGELKEGELESEEYEVQLKSGAKATLITIGGSAFCTGGSTTVSYSVSYMSSVSRFQYLNASGSYSYGAWGDSYISFTATVGRNYNAYIDPSNASTHSYTSRVISEVSDPSAPTIIRDPNTSPVCEGTSLDVTLSNSGSGGCGTIGIEYQYYNGSWSSWSGSAPSFSAVSGTNYYRARRTATGSGCDDSPYDQVSWSVSSSSDAGTMSVTNSGICPGGSTSFSVSGTTGFQQMQYQWNGTGGSWTNWSSSNPHPWSSSNAGNTLYVRSWAQTGGCASDYSAPVSCEIYTESQDPTDVNAVVNP